MSNRSIIEGSVWSWEIPLYDIIFPNDIWYVSISISYHAKWFSKKFETAEIHIFNYPEIFKGMGKVLVCNTPLFH